MNNDLRNIWVEVEGELTPKSENELREILIHRSRKIIRRYKWLPGIGMFVCIGVLFFLAISTVALRNDILYLINNLLLAILIVTSLIYYILFFRDLQNKLGENQNVTKILNEKARKIERAFQQKNQILLLPVISLLLLISIHVYFSSGSFIDIFQNEESMWGLTFGFLSALFVSLYFGRKIGRNQQHDLKILRKYLEELESV